MINVGKSTDSRIYNQISFVTKDAIWDELCSEVCGGVWDDTYDAFFVEDDLEEIEDEVYASILTAVCDNIKNPPKSY